MAANCIEEFSVAPSEGVVRRMIIVTGLMRYLNSGTGGFGSTVEARMSFPRKFFAAGSSVGSDHRRTRGVLVDDIGCLAAIYDLGDDDIAGHCLLP